MDKRKGKRTLVNLQLESDYSMDQLFEKFYHMKNSEGRTKNTLRSYVENYKFVKNFIANPEANISSITVEVVRSYIVWMLHEKTRFEGHKFKSEEEMYVGLSPTTVNIRIKFLRTFFSFLEKEGYTTENPMRKIKNINEDNDAITIISTQQLQKLLAVPDKKSYCGFRDYTLMNLLLDTFLRINEALSLQMDDIDIASGMISIRGETSKSRKTRIVPASKKTIQLITELIKINGDFDSDYIFLANYGERLEAGQFRHRLKSYAKKVQSNYREVE